MNAKKIVRLSNIICIISVVLLCYWVFSFIVMEVFGLKVFRENITQTFYLSILGIISLMFGALITNIMFNLTRIAEKHNNDTMELKKRKKSILAVFLATFPLIVVLLFLGDFLTSKKKENMLIKSAESIAINNQSIVSEIINYNFSKDWIMKTEIKLELLSNMDINYRNISLIVYDDVDGFPVFLILKKSTCFAGGQFLNGFACKNSLISFSLINGSVETSFKAPFGG